MPTRHVSHGLLMLLNGVPVPALYADAGHRVRACNAAWACSAEGPHQVSLVGLHLRDLLGATAYEALLAAIARGEAVSVETSGEAGCPRALTCAPDLAPDGRIQGLVLMREEPSEEAAGQAVTALHERAEELSRLMDLVPVPVFVAHDARAARITGNPAAHAALRVPKDSNLWRTALPGEDVQHLRTFLDGREVPPQELPVQHAAIRGVEVRGAELRLVHDDGSVTDFLGTASPLFDAEGAVRGAIGTFMDISERKRLEAALRESQALAERQLAELEAVYGSAPIGLCVLDADLRYVRINERLAAMNGLPVSAHLGRSIWEVLPDAADKIAPIFRRVLATGEPVPDTDLSRSEVAGRDEEQHGIASFFPLKSPDGRVVGVNVAVVEITDRKRVEDALRESEQRFAAFMDNSPTPAYLKDTDGRHVYMNRAGAELLGRTPAQVIGKVDTDLFSEEDAERMRQHDLAALAAGGPMEFPEEILCNGVLRHFRSIKFRIDAPGRSYLGGISVDITEQKRADEEREQLLEAERAARGEAERANRMKDEFLATLSHELRTPLSAVLGYVQMLRGGQIRPEGVARALEIIERNARVQSELISDLLDMNRIVTGKLQLDLVPLDLAAIVDAAVESVRQGADAKGQRLEVDVARAPKAVVGDPARLQQVLWNLLTNAVKFTPRDGSVKLTVRPVDDGIEVRVADTGQGIDADFLPHVFDRFRQADASATRQHRGLGLGLAICKQLVELHGGTICAESSGPGQGALFTVRLPTGTMTEEVGTRSSDARSAAATAGAALRGVKALVVDDEPDARELVRQLLEAQGMDIRAAASAEEALSAVQEEVPAAIISDIGMPREDGYALIRKLRSLPPERGGSVPAIALTAFARPEDQARTREAGYQHHLAKPIDAGQLYAAIEGLVAPARKSA